MQRMTKKEPKWVTEIMSRVLQASLVGVSTGVWAPEEADVVIGIVREHTRADACAAAEAVTQIVEAAVVGVIGTDIAMGREQVDRTWPPDVVAKAKAIRPVFWGDADGVHFEAFEVAE